MTDTASVRGEARAGFEVASRSLTAGVQCRSCGRVHLPARLWPLAITARPGAGAAVDLRCVRCKAIGSLLLDPDKAEHRALLAVWRDQLPGAADRKEPA